MAGKFIANVNKSECVSCGVCVNTCPMQTITIIRGLFASVNEDGCIGCRKCMNACPASVITMKERGVVHD